MIQSLQADIDATNALRKYRKSIGSTQQARYPYNWWQIVMVTLTYFPNGASIKTVSNIVESNLSMSFNGKANVTLLADACIGIGPDKVRREYTRNLPEIVKATGLTFRDADLDDVTHKGSGQPPKFAFYFKKPMDARAILIAFFPELLPMFVELDRVTRSR